MDGSLVCDNEAPWGGGVFGTSDIDSITNSTICRNRAEAGGGFVPGQMNDLVGTDQAPLEPGLGPLAENGGGTLTHALLTTSLAVDAGGAARCPGIDQRGTWRMQDGNGDDVAGCDIGAYELESH